MSETLHRAQVWLDSCRKFVITCEQQLDQAKRQLAKVEERVAELEATTADKGNRKVTVTLYGRVNRIVNFWDDGVESNTYTLNSSYSPTRWGLSRRCQDRRRVDRWLQS